MAFPKLIFRFLSRVRLLFIQRVNTGDLLANPIDYRRSTHTSSHWWPGPGMFLSQISLHYNLNRSGKPIPFILQYTAAFLLMAAGKCLPCLIYICWPSLFFPLFSFLSPLPQTGGYTHTCDGSHYFSLETMKY